MGDERKRGKGKRGGTSGAPRSQRPPSGESVSQPPPGAMGDHANPTAPGVHTEPAPLLCPGEALLPEPSPDMPATGAERGPHPPGPEAGERRLAQQDWERWRAADRRRNPYVYPHWRT